MARDLASRLEEMRRRLRRDDVTDDVPEWAEFLAGERVYVREFVGTEQDEWDAEQISVEFGAEGEKPRTSVRRDNMTARLVSRVLVYEDGTRVFPDAGTLGASVPGEILNRLWARACEVCGLGRKRGSLKDRPFGSPSTASPSASAGAPSNGACATSAAAS